MAGASAAIPLLQFQVTGQAKKAFIYQVAVVVRNALLQHPDTAVRRMQDLETILSIRLVLGEDSQSGPADPDGAGVVESQPAHRSIIVYILNYKVENALLASCPCLGVVMVQGQPPESGLPAPWMLLSSPERILVPKRFAALPPRGHRHIVVQAA